MMTGKFTKGRWVSFGSRMALATMLRACRTTGLPVREQTVRYNDAPLR